MRDDDRPSIQPPLQPGEAPQDPRTYTLEQRQKQAFFDTLSAAWFWWGKDAEVGEWGYTTPVDITDVRHFALPEPYQTWATDWLAATLRRPHGTYPR